MAKRKRDDGVEEDVQDKKTYIVQADRTIIDSKVYNAGDEVEMTDEEAQRHTDADVRLVPKDSLNEPA